MKTAAIEVQHDGVTATPAAITSTTISPAAAILRGTCAETDHLFGRT